MFTDLTGKKAEGKSSSVSVVFVLKWGLRLQFLLLVCIAKTTKRFQAIKNCLAVQDHGNARISILCFHDER